jgi:hypothetical protein
MQEYIDQRLCPCDLVIFKCRLLHAPDPSQPKTRTKTQRPTSDQKRASIRGTDTQEGRHRAYTNIDVDRPWVTPSQLLVRRHRGHVGANQLT